MVLQIPVARDIPSGTGIKRWCPFTCRPFIAPAGNTSHLLQAIRWEQRLQSPPQETTSKETSVHFKPLAILLVLTMFVTQLPAVFGQQSSNNWSAVQQLTTNSKLIVKQKSGGEVKGLMIEATDTTLIIDRKGKPVSIARPDVQQVYVSERKAAKGKWAAIGAGIGGGTGATIGAINHSSESDDNEIYAVMGLLIGVGACAVGGLLFGQSRRKRELVYSAF